MADVRLIHWLLSQKRAGPLTEDWFRIIDEGAAIRQDLQSAWQEFLSHGSPQGESDAWKSHTESLRAALRNARLKIDDLGRSMGRSNPHFAG
jgi:hypothetical protein